ncbi:TonB-dependent receptor [Methylobacterium sp. CB376]|uniref:TonB-dependent receptor n=1 Tax=Methylobacterium sp. CB376 TaxID=3138063 RepID=UPI0024B1AF3D|nr:TonB-dependent receptor [Methylobacterium nodulans]WFT81368.1 TonB-dependent receptor [Methylobacterium nodulans]WFT81417.1 TonB-dependent receptor [Methylobacterium nodulans]
MLADPKGAVGVACAVAVGSVGTAQAQQAPAAALPPLNVDAPIVRPRPPAPQPTKAQVKARTALRQVVRARQVAAPPVAAPAPSPAAGGAAALAQLDVGGSPYADPAAPYKADRLASNRFTQPILNTPKSITVVTREVLNDKNATSFRDLARTTAGVTLGTGEGGNAFGDRFFIRGFDARNDVFIDGIRDPSVSVRENFFTEQIEILRGPASTFAGRGTAGGAVNIVTKQAGFADFVRGEGQLGTDATRRVTLDVNQVISPALAVRVNGLYQEAGVAGRNSVYDDRAGAAVAVTLKPADGWTFTANYFHTDLDSLPDFGVPFNVRVRRPFTESIVPRDTYYGFVNRDFYRVQQDTGTLTAEYAPSDGIKLSNRFRAAHSVLDYVGTLPQAPVIPANGNLAGTTLTLSPQSRYQTVDVVADVADATFKFATGPILHTAVIGSEISRENVGRDTYAGLRSELSSAGTGGTFTGTGSLTGVNILAPPNLLPFARKPYRAGNPTTIPVDTKAAYLIETANYEDVVLLNGGVRYDDYNVSSTSGTSTVRAHSGLLNYNVGLTVKPQPFLSLYGAYATSSNPVGAELDASSSAYGGLSPTATVNQVFGPELNTAEEVGVKAELFDRHLLATAALFRTTKENARETVGTGAAATIVADAAYRVEGVDLELAGKITDRWSVFGGYVIMDTKVTKSANPATIGYRLANIAHRSFSMLTKYKVTNWLEFGLQAVNNSRISGGTLASNNNVLPSYWRFDAFLEAKVSENLTVKLYGQNLFDRKYYDAFYRSDAPFTFIAPGRSVYLIAQAKF